MPKYNAALMSIDPSETRRYAGLNKAPNFNKKTILEACREVLYISEPKGIWEVYDYDAKNGIVLADKPFKLEGKKVTKHLCRATKVAIIAVTIGETVEEEISRRFKDGEYKNQRRAGKGHQPEQHRQLAHHLKRAGQHDAVEYRDVAHGEHHRNQAVDAAFGLLFIFRILHVQNLVDSEQRSQLQFC